jgi:hypothetical protein
MEGFSCSLSSSFLYDVNNSRSISILWKCSCLGHPPPRVSQRFIPYIAWIKNSCTLPYPENPGIVSLSLFFMDALRSLKRISVLRSTPLNLQWRTCTNNPVVIFSFSWRLKFKVGYVNHKHEREDYSVGIIHNITFNTHLDLSRVEILDCYWVGRWAEAEDYILQIQPSFS